MHHISVVAMNGKSRGTAANLRLGAMGIALSSILLCTPILAVFSSAAEPDLTGRLLKVAEDEFNRLNARPSNDSRSMLIGLINKGANRLQAEGATEEQIAKAQQNLRRFVEEMVKIGKDRGETWPDGRIRTGEATYAGALKICPLWPFC